MAEGTRVQAHSEGCLVFACQREAVSEGRNGERHPRPTGGPQDLGLGPGWGVGDNTVAMIPAGLHLQLLRTSTRFCPFYPRKRPISISREWGQMPPSRALPDPHPSALTTMPDLEVSIWGAESGGWWLGTS